MIKLNYFKMLFAVFIISVATLASFIAAEAQVLVRDVNTRNAVRDVGTDVTRAVNDASNARGDFETNHTQKHYEAEIEKYDAQIARLEHLIHSMSYHDPSAAPAGVPTRDSDLYTKMVESRTKLKAMMDLTESATEFRVTLATGEQSNFETYLENYGFFPGGELYPKSTSLANMVDDSQYALYQSMALIRESINSDEARYDTYLDLETRAKNTQDLRAAIEVNNALLIENGRNLALLIQLQTGHLSTNAGLLREKVRQEHTVPRLFGANSDETGPSLPFSP